MITGVLSSGSISTVGVDRDNPLFSVTATGILGEAKALPTWVYIDTNTDAGWQPIDTDFNPDWILIDTEEVPNEWIPILTE